MILEASIWPGSRRVRNPEAADAPVAAEGGLAGAGEVWAMGVEAISAEQSNPAVSIILFMNLVSHDVLALANASGAAWFFGQA
jgi:hypothetical protein